MYENIRVPPPIQVFPLLWFFLYLVKSYLLYLVYFSCLQITLMLYRRPQTVIFLVFKQAGPNTVSYKKGWNLPQTGLNLVAPQISNCDYDA